MLAIVRRRLGFQRPGDLFAMAQHWLRVRQRTDTPPDCGHPSRPGEVMGQEGEAMQLITNAIERALTPKQRSKGFAKIVASLLLGLGAIVCASAGAQDMEAISQAEAAATAWLALVDAGNYAGSWEQSAGLFKAALTQSSWVSAAQAKRAPLGALKLREVNSTAFTRKMPGARDGEYVVIMYASQFENRANATEIVTPVREKDGSWRVSGYDIR
jgi:hypothetical protein